MKYLDVASLFDGDPAHLALLSTFQFDPDFFERRLLRCDALQKARRIVVFVDSREWLRLLRQESPARLVNRRYLVVPVSQKGGLFHPKLTLVLTEDGGRVLCGSNNLTRSGCSSNLELLNTITWARASPIAGHLTVVQKAFAFFEQAAIHGEIGVGRIAKEWIADAGDACPWLKTPASVGAGERVRLVHSYESGLWSELSQQLAQDDPSEFFIVSPFHDADNAMCSRLSDAWPAAKIEMLVQSQVTRLAVPVLKRLKTVRLSELINESRRVHAKLLAWRGRHGSGCIAGSANFTCAAFDGRNVEACLFVDDSAGPVDELFDARLSKRGLAFDEFEPGVQGEPDSDDSKEPPLHLRSIVMGRANHLSLSYVNDLPATALRLSIRAPGESLPRVSVGVPRKPHAVEDVTVPE
nr:hypothetical protein [Acidobacteriota bacterium]